jgi:hypothetical protein
MEHNLTPFLQRQREDEKDGCKSGRCDGRASSGS